jgi:hypothetical protein
VLGYAKELVQIIEKQKISQPLVEGVFCGLTVLVSFHPEMPLFRNLGVNLRDFLCDVPNVRLRAIPWFP